MTNLDAIHRLEKLWTDIGEDRLWFKHSKIREIAVNFARKLDALEAPRPEVQASYDPVSQKCRGECDCSIGQTCKAYLVYKQRTMNNGSEL
jgi:hypothetical protein